MEGKQLMIMLSSAKRQDEKKEPDQLNEPSVERRSRELEVEVHRVTGTEKFQAVQNESNFSARSVSPGVKGVKDAET